MQSESIYERVSDIFIRVKPKKPKYLANGMQHSQPIASSSYSSSSSSTSIVDSSQLSLSNSTQTSTTKTDQSQQPQKTQKGKKNNIPTSRRKRGRPRRGE